MIVSMQQRAEVLKISQKGRGGIFLDPQQREKLCDVAIEHFENMTQKQGKPNRAELIKRIKSDPELKGFIGFILLAAVGAVIAWIVNYLMDEWFKRKPYED